MRRYKRQTASQQESVSVYKKLLTTAQEETLITHINRLTDRGLPPTPKILENIAKELIKQQPGKKWVYRFCQRYEDCIKSRYLRAIDQQRQIADNSPYFQHFFNTVSSLLYLSLISTNFGS